MKNFKRLLLYLTLLLLFILAILLITNNFNPEIPNTSSVTNNLESYINDYYIGLLDAIKSVLQPVSVDYSNEVLSNQIYSISITLFILSVIILFLLIVFVFSVISFIYSEKILKYFTNKYIVKYITFNREILKIEIIFLSLILIYFMYNLIFGLHFLATHPININ